MPEGETEGKTPNLKRRRKGDSQHPCKLKSEPHRRMRSSSSPDSAASIVSYPNGAKWFRNPSVVWFRGHDLRVEDHPALLAAAQRGGPVVPLFIWDDEDQFGRDLGNMKSWWLKRSLYELAKDLKRLGVQLYTRVGRSTIELRKFIKATGSDAVFWNRCYEPDLLERDEKMRVELGQDGMTAESFKAELLVEPWELSSSSARPAFKTFHEYMRAWMAFPPPPQPFPCPSHLKSLNSISKEVDVGDIEILGLECPSELAADLSKIWVPGSAEAKSQLEQFLKLVFPAFGDRRFRRHFKGTSRLSPHVRFGELSPRRMYHATRICVSRWEPNGSVPAPLAALVGLSSVHNTRNSEPGAESAAKFRVMSRKGLQSDESLDASESSACSSQYPNNINGAVHRANGISHRRDACVKGESTPSMSNTHNAKHTQEPAGPTTTSSEVPHISLSAKAFLKNLCLRDFSYHVLFHHPEFDTRSLVPEFSRFPWAEDGGTFEAWRTGSTGYPIVDASMRELRSTGWIHNGMRFLLACFLTKYLLLPWQRGLKEFYGLLMDGDHSANALGWQWTSGSNTDSFPFSCLVNPVKIAHRLDPSGEYVRTWLPELAKIPLKFLHQPWKAPESVLGSAGLKLGVTYPNRIVEPGQARRRAKEAMRFMKQVFASMRPSRTVSSVTVDDLLREWPLNSDAEDENSNNDNTGGKAGLLPSLWSLLQCQDPADVSTIENCAPKLAFSNGSTTEQETMSPMNSDSIERVMFSTHSSLDHACLLSDSIQLMGGSQSQLTKIVPAVGRRDSSERPKPIHNDVQNGTVPIALGGQSSLVPNSQHSLKENGTPAASVPHQSVARGANTPNVGDIPQFPVQRHHQPAVIMPMQVNQMHHRPANPHQISGNAVLFDPVYGTAVTPAPGAPIPMTNFPMMMGPGHTGVDIGLPNGLNHSEFNNHPVYPHQMFYGLPFQMMQSRLGGTDGDQAQNHGTASNGNSMAAAGSRHMGMHPNFPVAYGMYGSHSFDPNTFANAMGNPEAGQYAPVHIAPHQPTAPRVLPRGLQHLIPSNHMHMPSGAGADGMHLASAAYGSGTPNHGTRGFLPNTHSPHNRDTSLMPASEHSTDGKPGGDLAGQGKKVSREAVSSPNPTSGGRSIKRARSLRRADSNQSGVFGGVAKSGNGSRRSVCRANSVKSPTKARGRSSSRGKRNSGGRNGKNRSDSRSGIAVGSSSRVGITVAKGSRSDSVPVENALKARQLKLEKVSLKEDHDYFHFARFLTKTYELTKNTDRQTSKDYIRLCTLKDNYHKHCESDKEKLKIYTIKAFFSKILELEVTGEWDRHNHGGVRGPYVYGIKLKPNRPEEKAGNDCGSSPPSKSKKSLD